MNFSNPMFPIQNSNVFLSQYSFGDSYFTNLNNDPTQIETISLLKQPDSLRKQNGFTSLDNQGNLFCSNQGMLTLFQNNQIETELIKAFSADFRNNLEQMTNTMTSSYKNFAYTIRKILKEKSELTADYLPYLIQFSFFDFFIVNNDNLSYKFNIRDELIYKLFLPDLNNFELFKLNHSNQSMDKSSIEIQIHKITFLLLICDFSQAIPLIQSIIENIEKSEVNYIQTDYRQYIDFFMNLGSLCEQYLRIIKESKINNNNVNHNQIETIIEAMHKEISFEMERIIKGIKNNNINSKFNISLVNILLIIKGDPNTIGKLLNENNLSWYFIILCHIFYRGYQNDFLDCLVKIISSINFKPQEKLEKDLLNIISKSQSNQLEAIKGIKAKVPFVLYFVMLSIINDIEFINLDDAVDLYKYEYNEFLNTLFNHDITIDDFINYFFGYVDTYENNNMIFIHNFAVKQIEQIFHKQIPNHEIKKEIDSIKSNISRFQMMKDSLIIVNKICFHNYLRLNYYEECFEAYLDYYKYVSEKNDTYNNVSGNDLVVSDPILSERDDMFDLILTLVLNNNQWEPLSEIYSRLSNKTDLPRNVHFLFKYVQFQTEKDVMPSVINNFFSFCFVSSPYPGCPAMLWLFVLEQLKDIIEDKSIKLHQKNVKIALDNLILYEVAIKRRMKQYWKKNTEKTIDCLFEELTLFLFDLKNNLNN